MHHSRVCLRVHRIFTTKDRRRGIPDELQPRLWAFIGGVARELGMIAVAVGGTADHVHILLQLPPTMRPAEAVQKVKANSSRWMHEITGKRFFWQEATGAFSIGISQTDATVKYILQQREHDTRHSVDDEVESIYKKLSA